MEQIYTQPSTVPTARPSTMRPRLFQAEDQMLRGEHVDSYIVLLSLKFSTMIKLDPGKTRSSILP